jgi:hypothetical protein
MKRITLALTLTIAAALLAAACLEKDTTSTIYLRQDGSFDWVIIEQNVRSDERDDSARLAEESSYVDAVSRGGTDTVSGLLALGAEDVRVRWLRNRRPYAVMVDGRFDNLAGVFDRMLGTCGLPFGSAITEVDGVKTWTLRADVGVDGERLDHATAERCADGLDGLTDALDVTIILESGSFTAAMGFIMVAADTAQLDDEALEKSVETTGLVELSLSWR